MAELLTEEKQGNLKLIIPFALAGYTFYSGYAKKGKTDWQSSAMMALIVFVCAYIVVSQTFQFMNGENKQ